MGVNGHRRKKSCDDLLNVEGRSSNKPHYKRDAKPGKLKLPYFDTIQKKDKAKSAGYLSKSEDNLLGSSNLSVSKSRNNFENGIDSIVENPLKTKKNDNIARHCKIPKSPRNKVVSKRNERDLNNTPVVRNELSETNGVNKSEPFRILGLNDCENTDVSGPNIESLTIHDDNGEMQSNAVENSCAFVDDSLFEEIPLNSFQNEKYEERLPLPLNSLVECPTVTLNEKKRQRFQAC